MATNSPDTIPAEYQADALQDAYRRGWNHGHGIACHNVPTIGDKVFSENIGRVTVDADNIREVHADACYQAESNSRSYSPFEFTAHEFNSADPESLDVEPQEDGSFNVVGPETTEESGFETEELAQAYIDAMPDSDELWQAFEAGTNDAIAADLAEYTDEDYGIETEEEDSD